MKTTWRKLQMAFSAAYNSRSEYASELACKYGVGNTAPWYTASEARKQARLACAADKAADACLSWLYAHSPRSHDWDVGNSEHWICTALTEEQALSETPDALPPPQHRRAPGF